MIWPREAWFEPVERFREKLGTMGEGVTVGIWDDGICQVRETGRKDEHGQPVFEGFPDYFGARMTGKSYVDADPKRYDAPIGATHGSEIARIIGAEKDQWGIAPRCELVMIKGALAKDRFEYSALVADAPVYGRLDLINISYAFDDASVQEIAKSTIVQFQKSLNGDKLIVAGVGNFTQYAGLKRTYPSCGKSVLGVNATLGWSNQLFEGSTKSKRTDLCAPGANLQNHYSTERLYGTSFASAIVSGLCCLVMAHRRQRGLPIDPATMHTLMRKACPRTEHDDLLGRGVIDLARLVELASEEIVPEPEEMLDP